MTLNAKIGGFMDFLGNFGLWDTLREQIAPKPIQIDMDKLRTKFSAFRRLKSQFYGFYGFFGNFRLRHMSISFTTWSQGTIIMCTSARL